MTIAIKIDNLSKQYRLGLVSTRTLSHDLNRWYQTTIRGKEDPYLKIGESGQNFTAKTQSREEDKDNFTAKTQSREEDKDNFTAKTQSREENDLSLRLRDSAVKDSQRLSDSAVKNIEKSDYIWALKDINLEVSQGTVLGIIGKNGAGKSTLLKILSKVTAPTTGTIKANGRIASLLEVGTGFHPEMTGRENIYMNGAIMGMSKTEITRKLDEIIDFAGVETFIDTPVKRYSSGMTVRLGFAVAAHLEPEILVVDEVLALGDAEFQKKAIRKMQDISKNIGRTVLFVSHNLDSIQSLCSDGIILENGIIDFKGDVYNAVRKYYQDNHSSDFAHSLIENCKPIYNSAISINKYLLLKNGNILIGNVKDSDEIIVFLEFELKKIINNITIGISLFDEFGHYIYRTLHTDSNSNINNKLRIGINHLFTTLKTDFLKSGYYNVALDISIHNEQWIFNPFNDNYNVLSFVKTINEKFSLIHSSKAIVEPFIVWRLNDL